MLEKFEGEKKKQYMFIGIAIAVAMGAVFLLSNLTSSDTQTIKKKAPEIKIVSDKDVEEEPFKKVYGEKIGLLEEEIKELKQDIKMMNELLKEKNTNFKVPDVSGKYSKITSPPSNPPIEGPKIVSPEEKIEKLMSQPSTPVVVNQPQPQPQKQKEISVKVLDNLIAFEGQATNPADTQELEQNSQNETQTQNQSQKAETKTVENTIPAGSFVQGVLLSGLDAPTSGSAVRNPHPVLIKLINKAILPNKWKVNIKDCFVIGSGYGDLSSERAYIRLERLSCTKNDGSIISKTVEGYVSGEDGKNGLKGRVVSKQGQLLARTLVAGFLQGVSQAFSYSSQNLLISPQGAVQTVNPNNALQYAGISGVSEAAKKLADFYMNLVNKTFPVIEILPGRKIDIVFLKDVKMED